MILELVTQIRLALGRRGLQGLKPGLCRQFNVAVETATHKDYLWDGW
jgi:hypothetical protein